MADTSFFDSRTEQSRVKTEIVLKYFNAWSNVMLGRTDQPKQDMIAYIDPFCGPGTYFDGTESTPLKIIRHIESSEKLSQRVATYFFDENPDYVELLKKALTRIANIISLKYQPIVKAVTMDDSLADLLESKKLPPSLWFLDPWGYEGLSLKLFRSVIKDYGSEVILFFNYDRINRALSNPGEKKNMEALFGSKRASKLSLELLDKGPKEREITIVETFKSALNEITSLFIIPYRFESSKRQRTSHYLFFFTKHKLGLKIMKEIMASESRFDIQGIPRFELTSGTPKQQSLFNNEPNLEDLKVLLQDKCAGQRLNVKDIYDRYLLEQPYTLQNLKQVLLILEQEKKINTIRPQKSKKKEPFGSNVVISFPEK